MLHEVPEILISRPQFPLDQLFRPEPPDYVWLTKWAMCRLPNYARQINQSEVRFVADPKRNPLGLERFLKTEVDPLPGESKQYLRSYTLRLTVGISSVVLSVSRCRPLAPYEVYVSVQNPAHQLHNDRGAALCTETGVVWALEGQELPYVDWFLRTQPPQNVASLLRFL